MALIAWSACTVVSLLAATLCAQPVSLSVSQTWTDGSAVTVYLYPRGQDGLPAVTDAPVVTATVGGQTLNATSVKPFAGGIAYILLVDISKSMRPQQFDELLSAMKNFAVGLGPQDRMAIVTFGDEVQVLQDFSADAPALVQGISGLKPIADRTKFHLALSRALELGQRMDAALPKRRAIVVLTDGKDEDSGLNAEDVLNTMRDARVPVYSIGSSRLPESEKKQYLDSLRRISANSGGEYFDAAASFSESYEKIRRSVGGVLLAQFDCSHCPRTGKPEPWTFSLKSGEKVLTASTAITMQASSPSPVESTGSPTPSPVPSPDPQSRLKKNLPLIGGTVPVAILIIALAVRRRRKRQMLAQPLAVEPVAGAPLVNAPPPIAEVPPPPPIVLPAPPPAAIPGVAVKLFVMRGEQKEAVHDVHLARPTSFGSGPSCGFALPKERSLAAQQFELSYGNQRVLIRDLSGKASTTVNGVPIHGSHPLNHGDVIGAGGAEFRLLIGK
jgi:hypothetical protein